jgi:predicted exporter
LAVTLGIVALAWVGFSLLRMNSDILDLMPQKFDSVQVFKLFERDLSSAREVTMGIRLDPPKGATDAQREAAIATLDAYVEHFTEQLAREPWVLRMLDKSVIDASGAVLGLDAVAIPLVFDRPEAEARDLLRALEPKRIEDRLSRLKGEMAAGSQKAAIELEFDPLGLLIPAMNARGGARGLDFEKIRPLAADDGTMRLLMVRTTQEDLGPVACQQLLDRIFAFRNRISTEWNETHPGEPTPEVLITGRTPYVGELSRIMANDLSSTFITSVVLVTLIFWLAFRRPRALGAIAHVLILSCLFAVTCGAFLFRELNQITVGLCSILVGLGVDAGLVLYSIYAGERRAGATHGDAVYEAIRRHGSAVLFGAVTTAAAFFCLLRSECSGFAQLGVLVGFGILGCAVLMLTVLFALLGRTWNPGKTSAKGGTPGRSRYAEWALRNGRSLAWWSVGVSAALAVVAAHPGIPLPFEANPSGLEPQTSEASRARRQITAKLSKHNAEPVLAVIQSKDPEEFDAHWQKARAAWGALETSGFLATAAMPSMITSPDRVNRQFTQLTTPETFTAAAEAVRIQIDQLGLAPMAMAPTLATLDKLAAWRRQEQPAIPSWRKELPAQSPLWFLMDRFVTPDDATGVAFIWPSKPLKTMEDKAAFDRQIAVAGVPVRLSGWGYALVDLVAWSQSKMVELTGLMFLLNIVILLRAFKSSRDLWIVMGGQVMTLVLLVAALKLMAIVSPWLLGIGTPVTDRLGQLLGTELNLFNVLALPLVLGVGVDYAIYAAHAASDHDSDRATRALVLPVFLSALTTVVGFGSNVLAQNPALSGLGFVCALGVSIALVVTALFVVPACRIWGSGRGTPQPSNLTNQNP